jgi:hypothetical protein
MPDGVKTPTSFSTVDEQTKAATKKAATPKKPQSPVEAALGRDIGKSTATKETPEERTARIAAEREKTQSGLNPNNPKPTEDPGPGMYWANYGGVWRKYKYVTNPVGGGGGGGGGGGEGEGDESKFTATDGTKFEDEATYLAYQKMLDEKETAMDIKKREGQSAYDLLYTQFAQYGMGSLVEPLKQFIQQGLSKSEFTLRLRETEAYKKRFAANAKRIAAGLSALDEADYIGLEDQYQNIMRQYGLPASYYTKGDLGRQEGFEKFLENDVSAAELEDRVMTAQSRVLNANPEVLASLKEFYPGITNGDILAYTLDPQKGLSEIKRKVTAAEIGGAAMQAGLRTGMARAEELGAAGVTKAQAQEGFQTVADVAPRGGQLAAIYGESPYTQQTAEQEIFGLAGSTEAAKQRKKLKGLEEASFAGRSGMTQGALGRERAGNL